MSKCDIRGLANGPHLSNMPVLAGGDVYPSIHGEETAQCLRTANWLMFIICLSFLDGGMNQEIFGQKQKDVDMRAANRGIFP